MGSKPKGYSASRVGAILGLSQYNTPLESWQKLMEERKPGVNKSKGYELPVFEGNAATRFGLGFENAICKLVEEKFNTKIINREKAFSKVVDGIEYTTHIDGQFEGENILDENKTTNIRAFHSVIDEKLNWGKENTDECPATYQAQASVQMLCSGADLVRLNVLIFPSSADEFEKEGWKVDNDGITTVLIKDGVDQFADPYLWAHTFAQIGNFKTYLLPKNKELEKAITQKVKEFHENHILTAIPPKCTDYKDIRRILTMPIGTILADDNLKKLCKEYSELTRQLGSASPLLKRKEKLKVEINNLAMSLNKSDWSDPPDKLVILDKNGGVELASISKSGFRAKRAK